MKTKLAIICIFLVTLLASGCSSNPSNSNSSEKVVIGTAKDPNLASQIIIAEEKGYFQESGLNAEVKLFSSGADLVSAAVSGDIQFASTGDIPTLNLKLNGTDIAVLSKISNIGGAQAILTSDAIAQDPKSLKGKKIGLKKGSVSEILLNAYLDHIGLQKSDIQIVEVTGVDAITAFTRGDIDAFSTWEPFVMKGEEAGAKILARARNVDQSNQQLVGIYSYLWGARKTVESQSGVESKILSAMAKSTEFIKQNPEESASIVAKKLDQDEKVIQTMMSENVYDIAINQQMVNDMKKSIQFLVDSGIAKESMSPEQIIYDEPLKKLNSQYVDWK